MNCPYCNSSNSDKAKFCTSCGAKLPLPERSVPSADSTVKTASGAGLLLGNAARQARLTAEYDPDQIISDRAYNGVILGVLLYGIIVNILLCTYVGNIYNYVSPILFTVLYVVLAFAGILISGKSHNPWISFLGYNMVVVPFGLVISTLVEAYGGIDSSIVTNAFTYTMLITLGMTATAIAFPRLFEKLGGALLGVLIGVIICEVVLLLFGVDQIITDWIAASLFSLYIGYDIYRSQQFPRTLDNAVDSALDIYLDIANLFIRLLQIFARRKD